MSRFESNNATPKKRTIEIDDFPEPKKGKIINKPNFLTRRIGLSETVKIIAQQGEYFIVEIFVGGSPEGMRIPKSFVEMSN